MKLYTKHIELSTKDTTYKQTTCDIKNHHRLYIFQ